MLAVLAFAFCALVPVICATIGGVMLRADWGRLGRSYYYTPGWMAWFGLALVVASAVFGVFVCQRL